MKCYGLIFFLSAIMSSISLDTLGKKLSVIKEEESCTDLKAASNNRALYLSRKDYSDKVRAAWYAQLSL
jgi:hypothetical protein